MCVCICVCVHDVDMGGKKTLSRQNIPRVFVTSFNTHQRIIWGFSVGKKLCSPGATLRAGDTGCLPGLGRWQPIVFLPGESHGQMKQGGYSP